MPRVLVGGNEFADIEAAEGYADYDGPVPPSGLYRCTTKLWNLVTNGSGDLMFKVLYQIAEPKGSEKSRFNGYGIWHNANLTAKSAPYTNAMLDALGIPRKAVWGESGRIIVDPEDPKEERVRSIGGKTPLGIAVKVQARRAEYPAGSGEFKLESKSFFKADRVESEGDPDDEILGGSSAPAAADDEPVSASPTNTPADDATPASDAAGQDDDDSF